MQDKAVDAIREGNNESLRQLIRDGADLNRLDPDGRTPLMHAVLGHGADLSTIELLLDHGADANVHDRLLGWTALHYAARDQKAAVVALLLTHGANADEEDVFGDTPLWRCITDTSPSPAIMSLLIEGGADPLRTHPMGICVRDIADSLDHAGVSAAMTGAAA
jgi:ankyrin repeat protein